MPHLVVENLSVNFNTRNGVVHAVKELNFSVNKGQVLGIVGESGSGKSVACYSLMGLLAKPPAQIISGSARYEGLDLLQQSEKALRSLRGSRIGMIFQDPMTSLNPHMTIAQQLMEPLLVHDKINKMIARKRAIEVLNEVGIRAVERRIDCYPHEFSGGMRQRVMIAMALIKEPDLLIADEPTTALDVTVQAQIIKLIQAIQARRGLTVILISHDLAVVADVADDVVVMQNGQLVEAGAAQVILRSPQHTYTKDLIAAIPTTAKPGKPQFDKNDSPILDVVGLHKTYRTPGRWFGLVKGYGVRAVRDVSFSLRRGEVLGLVGESGSGKSTVGRAVVRLIEVDAGTIQFNGQDLRQLSAIDLRSKRRDVQMIFQDPYASLNPRMTVYDCLAEPLQVHGIVSKCEYRQEVQRLMAEVGLSGDMIRKYPHEFSGGQRQRIAIARALALRPKIIIADEPVSALDVSVQAQILSLLIKLTEKYRLAMLFISHDLAVVRYVSDRIMVMQSGEVVEYGEAEQIYSAPRMEYTKELMAAARHL